MTSVAKRILIVGGYGHVGSRLARRLVESQTGTVTIAGRSLDKAQRLAAHLHCKATLLDLENSQNWDDVLKDADIVIVCMDQKDASFAAQVLKSGKTYVDITASDALFQQIEALQHTARAHEARAILSVGLAPGLTNLLVKACTDRLDQANRVRIGIMLGLGDDHGRAAIEWTFQNLLSSPSLPHSINTFAFGHPPTAFPVIPFDFADQHVIQRRQNIPDTATYLSLVPAMMARAIFALIPVLQRSPPFSRWVRKLMPYLRFGSDRTALSVEVEGVRQGQPTTVRATMEGRKEAEITALVAAFVVNAASNRLNPSGVHHLDEIMSLEEVLPFLSENALNIDIEDVTVRA